MTDRLANAITELTEALREAARMEAATGTRAPDRLYSIDEASAALNLGRSLLYSEIAAGRLRSLKVGRRRLIAATSITDYIEQAAS